MHRLLAAPVLALAAASAAPAGLSFEHKDWQLACDNTRTCRAAGYQRDGDEPAVSLLLTRAAGSGQAVGAQVALGSHDPQAKLPAQVTLSIAGRSQGTIALGQDDATGTLSAAQVAAVLDALRGTSGISLTAGTQRWQLSNGGAAAVLLRMDDAQGRVGTQGALMRRGPAGDEGVLAAMARPVVRAAALPAGAMPPASLAVTILRSLGRAPKQCPDLKEPSEPAQIWRLAPGQVLVSARCWLAAYNTGHGFWVAADKPPYRPAVVSYDATEFDPHASTIVAVQKGRGLGDCFAHVAWVWDGTRFVHAEESTTGMCRMVAAGGPWSLPTLVSEVVPAAGKRTTEEKRK